jgi:filamentous hemagglutinin family protein
MQFEPETTTMRKTANASLPAARTAKRQLLQGCAIAAGLAALAYGGPALAQVAGTGTVVSGSATISPPGPGATTVTTGGSQTIINWVPTDNAPTGGDIDFLPAGNTWNFSGNGNYVVLNRFVNGSGGSLSRQIALSGAINSTDTATGAPGGSIWFYNAGGILLNSGSAINVGSLVLTTNDIDTTGGLFGPGGEIRFRGASGSTAAIRINAGASITADMGAAGGSYVALVAPRIVQDGIVNVNGSAAYVAAEQADIRINAGLFDINVLTGAEGGQVISHSGVTTGPEQQVSGGAQRIYMVAIPKNDAVSMLVSGQIGYQDAVSAVTDSDGAVILSAGYNITGGAIDTAPASSVGANITINDTLFRSNTIARASGDFLGQPIDTIPPVGGAFVPPPQLGRILVQGNALFEGDNSATINVGAVQAVGATGQFIVRSKAASAITVDGGQLAAGTDILVSASRDANVVTGVGEGGNASLTVLNGGSVSANSVTVSARGLGGFTDSGAGGTGIGGTASISVSGPGSALNVGSLIVDAGALGGGAYVGQSGPTVADDSGDGQGGTATLDISDGATVQASNFVRVTADGQGETGLVRSGDGAGGTARITAGGPGATFISSSTDINAQGFGGGSQSSSSGSIFSASAGNGVGGTASFSASGDDSTQIAPGNLYLSASGLGGGANAATGPQGGDGTGGDASVSADGAFTLDLNSLIVLANGENGGASSSGGDTGVSGDSQGGTVTVAASNGATIDSAFYIQLDAGGIVSSSENIGNGRGGGVRIDATSGGSVTTDGMLQMTADGGSFGGFTVATSGGTGDGGNIIINADGGSVGAGYYYLTANGSSANSAGSTGAAQGGNIDLFALGGGSISATDPSQFSGFNADGQSGYSVGGANGFGGFIGFHADGGTIDLAGTIRLSMGGYSGGNTDPAGGAIPVGLGGYALIEVLNGGTMTLGDFAADAEGRGYGNVESPGGAGIGAANGVGGDVVITLSDGTLSASRFALSANGFGGQPGSGSGTGQGGTISYTQTGGDASFGDMSITANGYGGSTLTGTGNGIGGTATMTLSDGSFSASTAAAYAEGVGGEGNYGYDDFSNPVQPAGNGGDGQGGTATIVIDGPIAIDTGTLAAYAGGRGGSGGDFSSIGVAVGNGGDGGAGTGGQASITVTDGSIDTGDLIADAGGIGGNGGNSYDSGSFGAPAGISVGGRGGSGTGGTATINLAATVGVANTLAARAAASGGLGGYGSVGNDGGAATGGLAQFIVTDFDAGPLGVMLDASALGGGGGTGNDGAGGDGGAATGGTARVEATGANGAASITQANFMASGTGGRGGDGNSTFFLNPVGPNGGKGGDGTGGTIEAVASENATLTLAGANGGPVTLASGGTGGDGGNGAFNGEIPGSTGGDGGDGGAGSGGVVHLLANGGTVSSAGAPVNISVAGTSGNGGIGGDGNVDAGGNGGNGANGAIFADRGGRIVIEALATQSGPGAMNLGDTTLVASDALAGRIEIRTDGTIDFASLDAETYGISDPTNNDTDVATSGIFVATTDGTINVGGNASLRSDGSVGVYGQAAGLFDITGDLTIEAGDQIDIRHDFGEGTPPTIRAGGDFTATAGSGISGATGSFLIAGGDLSLTASNGAIGVDRLQGSNIFVTASGAGSVEHAEADNDFIASAASFRTGLNSIITGGNIIITAPGAVDLGNSTAGGYVSVDGESIQFANIGAGGFVTLNASGTAPGAEGIAGGSIDAGSSISLSGNSIALTGPVTGAGPLFATGTGGAVSISDADVAGSIVVAAVGNISGSYVSGGDILLTSDADINASATANGGYTDPATGAIADGNVFADAAGNATLTNSGAARMFGVNAGQAATVTNATAGEDMLVLAGTTANLTNVAAGDDIDVRATGAIIANGLDATGAGLDGFLINYVPGNGFTIGQGEGTSSIDGSDIDITSSAASIDATNLSAGDDILLSAATTITLDGGTTLGLGITGGDSSIRTQGGDTVLTNLDAFDDIVATSAGAISGDAIAAGRNLALTAVDAIDFGAITVGGTTTLTSSDGAIGVDALNAAGPITASGDSIDIRGGAMQFASLTANVGNALIRSTGNLSIASGSVAGSADLAATGGSIALTDLSAGGDLNATASGAIQVDGIVSGPRIALASNDIVIAGQGRVGTAGTTQSLTLTNNGATPTFVGGNGTQNGYHADATEMTRLFATNITVNAPNGAAATDLIVDSFTLAGNSNLGAAGSLTLQTPGRARVIGAVELTGLTSANRLTLSGDDRVEIILGQGSIRLSANGAPEGVLDLRGNDIFVATAAAITDVEAATSTSASDTRLAQNDGVTSDEGALFAGGINVTTSRGFYVQNSGAGTDYAQRRGLTFAAGGLNVDAPSSGVRIVINGVRLGANGQVTGLDTIPFLTVNGSTPTSGTIDMRSTFNGCLIISTGGCTFIDPGNQFPVQDVVEDEVGGDGDGDGDGGGTGLPVPLITIRGIEPLSGAPLLDDPVTGAGNDDLWTPTTP